MSYTNILNELSQKNRFEYKHKAIYKQVKQAMKKQGELREQALREVLKSSFRKEAERYEPMRQKLVSDLYDLDGNEAYQADMAIRGMARPAQFLEQFAEIVGAMAKDIDATYTPRNMLGLTAQDAKNLVAHQLNSYTLLDETMYSFKKYGYEEAHRTIETIRVDSLTGETRDYATTDDEHKAGMHDTYMRKEAVKKELKDNGFFWRLIHRSEVKQMRNYIKAAEDALKEVKYTKQAAKEAEYAFSKSAAIETEYEKAYNFIDDIYKKQLANENLPNMADGELVQPTENKDQHEKVDLTDEFKEDKKIQKSEMVPDAPKTHKDLNI